MTTSPEGQRYIYYGSYDGGVEVRQLSSDGLNSSAASATRVAIGSRYEGTEVVQHSGFYYLFAKADGDGTMAETTESNNLYAVVIQVTP